MNSAGCRRHDMTHTHTHSVWTKGLVFYCQLFIRQIVISFFLFLFKTVKCRWIICCWIQKQFFDCLTNLKNVEREKMAKMTWKRREKKRNERRRRRRRRRRKQKWKFGNERNEDDGASAPVVHCPHSRSLNSRSRQPLSLSPSPPPCLPQSHFSTNTQTHTHTTKEKGRADKHNTLRTYLLGWKKINKINNTAKSGLGGMS